MIPRGPIGTVALALALFSIAAPSASAFTNNENAADLLGQFDDVLNPQPVYTKFTANDGPNRLGINAPEGMLIDETHHRLFLSDALNNRVLVYDLETDNTLTNYVPDNVIGQSNFYSNTASTTQGGLNVPQGLAYDDAGNRLFVAQSTGNRVTVYDTASITDGEDAVNVLGQSTFTGSAAGNTQAGMKSPQRIAYDASRGYLFVTQSSNNRVTVYDVNSITNGENAINVLGQSTFTAATAATTQAGLNVPVGVAYEPTRQYLYVAQSTGNRVSVFDVASITDGENAVNVLGQSSFTVATAASTQAGMNAPQGVAIDDPNDRLFVSQSTGNRVTVYDVATITNGESAINVLGQKSFTVITAATTQEGLSAPQGATYVSSSDRLYVTQSGNNRVSVFDVAAIEDGESAVNLIGQYDDGLTDPQPVFSTVSAANNGPNRLGFSAPTGASLDGTNHRLFVSDTTNNRVLVYNLASNNALTDHIPDYVLGQPDFHSNTAAVTQTGMSAPQYVEYDASKNRLFVSQSTANRVSIYDVESVTNGENAVGVLGQSLFTGTTATNTQIGLKTPTGMAYDAVHGRLFVTGQGNSRVTVYEEGESVGKNAVDLIGQYDDQYLDPQPAYTNFTAHNGPNRLGLSAPEGMAIDEMHHRLFLADASNNRILVYNLENDNTLTDYYPDNVIGQPNFYSNAAATTQSGMSSPQGLVYDAANNRLFNAQASSSRVAIYDTTTIENGEGAVGVLGQANFTTATAGNTQTGMKTPQRLAYDAARQYLFVTQSGNNRVTVYDMAAVSNGEYAINVLGQSTFTASVGALTQTGMNGPVGVAYDPTTKYLYVAEATTHRVSVFDLNVITDGEAAVHVLGQPNFTTQGGANSQTGMNSPQGVAVNTGSHLLYVSQSTGNRVTVYDIATVTDNEPAVNVLGQSTFTTSTAANTQAGLNAPQGMMYVPSSERLYVPQSGNNRVSVFDVASIADGEDAVNLIGQYDDDINNPQPIFSGAFAANNGPNRTGLSGPVGVAVDSVHHRLFVSDSANNRILVYNLNADDSLIDHIPDNVLGQVDFHSNAAATTQAGLNVPQYIAYDGVHDRLFVPQSTGQRVTVFDTASISDGEDAVSVLGQSTFTAATAANTQAGMKTPMGAAYDPDNDRLFVSQSGNHRVTVYDVASITNGENAINVLGQSTFTAATAATTQAGMNTPQDLTYGDDGRLYVAQSTGNRVTVYDVNAITDGENAINVLGQSTFTGLTAAATQAGMNLPSSVAINTGSNLLYVAQSTGNRVTVYDVATITDGENAVNVLGQSSYTTITALNMQSGLNAPRGIAYDPLGGRLYVAQATSNRVSVFDTSLQTISTGQPATHVLGQADFLSSTVATTQAGMNLPVDVAYDATNDRLFVSQSTSNRVTVYDTATITDGQNATGVLGQANFTAATAATTQAGMSAPNGLAYDSTTSTLYVASTINRVTAYDVATVTDGENATLVLGQANFTTSTAANTQTGLNGIRDLEYDKVNGVLYVVQATNNRVSVFGTPPAAQGGSTPKNTFNLFFFD